MAGSSAEYGKEEYQYEIKTVSFIPDHLSDRGFVYGRDAGSCG
jgi:hypothetical protein